MPPPQPVTAPPPVKPTAFPSREVREESDLQRLFTVLRKRAWLVGAFVAVGVTATALYTMRRPRIYEASASIVIDPTPPQVFGSRVQEVVQLGAPGNWSNQEYYNTQVKILEGYELAEKTVVANRLWENPEIVAPLDNDIRTQEELVRAATVALHRTLRAGQSLESRIVYISVRHTNSVLAAELANKHVETFLAYTRSLRTEGSGKAAQFLATELDTAEKRLKATEDALLSFKEKHDLLSVALEDKQSILAKDIQRYSDAITETRVKRLELDSLRKKIKTLNVDNILDSPIFALTANTAIGLLKDQYVRQKQRVLELSEDLGPKHPEHVAAQTQLDELYRSIVAEAQTIVRELDVRYETLETNEARFVAELDRLKKEAFDLGPKALEYTRLARQRQSDESNYSLVLERLRASEISAQNPEINVRPHELARDARLVSPRMKLNIALGFLIALALGVGVAFLLEFMDRTVKTAEDVEIAAGAPFLGIIPVVDSATGGDDKVQELRDLYVFKNPTSRAAECCRSIRTNILFSSADRPLKTLAVSSPRPREGKTTSTIFLGTIMAQGGHRVLLIDTDLRRPRLHKSLGVPRTRGVTNLVMGEISVEEAVKTTEIPNLYVLPCGPLPPNPAELLLSRRFHDMLRDLETRFDRILLDSPPLLAVTDGVVLARICDGVILISQAGKTSSDDVRQSARQLSDVGAGIVGVILNDMDLNDRRYSYYYQYHYGYGESLPKPEVDGVQ